MHVIIILIKLLIFKAILFGNDHINATFINNYIFNSYASDDGG